VLSSPHKDALLALASCASDAKEAERLKLLASATGKAQYTDYIAKQHRSLMEVRGYVGLARESGCQLGGKH
jgi:NADPH-ferrihemoprotein reductase